MLKIQIIVKLLTYRLVRLGTPQQILEILDFSVYFKSVCTYLLLIFQSVFSYKINEIPVPNRPRLTAFSAVRRVWVADISNQR